MLREEYAHLVGKAEFDQIYRMAVNSQPYSFLTILPHEQDEKRMFLARFDQALYVEDGEEEPEEPPPQPSLAQSSAGPPGGSRGRAGLSPSA